jgi:hypothetical protein
MASFCTGAFAQLLRMPAGTVAILAVQRLATLRKIPGEAGEAGSIVSTAFGFLSPLPFRTLRR